MLDQHVNRWHVEARQRVKLSHTNRSSGLKHRLPRAAANPLPSASKTNSARVTLGAAAACSTEHACAPDRSGGHSGGQYTRSHPELGRENPQRQWYCVLRRGRVGRRQVYRPHRLSNHRDRMDFRARRSAGSTGTGRFLDIVNEVLSLNRGVGCLKYSDG